MSNRKAIGLSDKLKIIQEARTGKPKKDIAKKYGLAPSTLSTILKNKEKNFKFAANNENLNWKKLRRTKYEEIDKSTLKFVKFSRERNLPVSGNILKEKAIDFSKTMGENDFKGSTGWLDKFKSR